VAKTTTRDEAPVDETEIARRRDAVLGRLAAMKPKPHKPISESATDASQQRCGEPRDGYPRLKGLWWGGIVSPECVTELNAISVLHMGQI